MSDNGINLLAVKLQDIREIKTTTECTKRLSFEK